ncbi:MAG TPA: tetratricopeptide repeat protein [Fimbriimonadaceae bacterium]|nr:tetratricopeptide repeat protein [Fimbriimonadaceae bacterium]
MSIREQARKLVDQAEIAIKANNPQYAAELLRQSILYYGKDADAYLLLGIALSQNKMPADAENALKRATQLAPDSVKARFNLAVHQYSQGQVRSALNNARRALEMSPEHEGSKSLAARIEKEMGLQPGEQPKTTAAGNPTPVETLPDEGLPQMSFIDRLGRGWVVVAWAIAALSLAGLLLTLPLALPMMGSRATSDQLMLAFRADPREHVLMAMSFGSTLLAILWIALDAIHRKGNLLWVLPQVFCGCIGFTWLIVPIYLLFGRREQPEDAGA